MTLKNSAKALVLCGDGINCDAETAFALNLAGFSTEIVHSSVLLNQPELLKGVKLLAIPGGFSFADEIASGKVLALKLKDKLKQALYNFVEQGNLVIGICNGFQILVQLGLLPDSKADAQRSVSLCKNISGKFINKWVELEVSKTNAKGFFAGLSTIHLPIRHGEGRLLCAEDAASDLIDTVKMQAPLRYSQDLNGSFDKIAALCNKEGNVLGLMPHPEAFVRWNQHPSWNQMRFASAATVGNGAMVLKPGEEDIPHGLMILKNAAAMLN